jgi:hypothetical protein
MIRGVVASAGLLAVFGLSSDAREAVRERTLFLIGLPAIGNLDWRCNGSTDFGLTFKTFRISATDEVVFSAGHVTTSRRARRTCSR